MKKNIAKKLLTALNKSSVKPVFTHLVYSTDA